MEAIDLKMCIVYDDEKGTIESYDFAGTFTVKEVAVIVKTFRKALQDWGYEVKRMEE